MLMVDGARFLPGTAYAYTQHIITCLNSLLSATKGCKRFLEQRPHIWSMYCDMYLLPLGRDDGMKSMLVVQWW